MHATSPAPRSANVVAIGHFNPAIITSEWLVAMGLVEAGATELELAIGDGGNVLRHKVQGFVITAMPRRLQIDSPPNNVLGAADLLARILALLAHTPVTTLGLNFHFAADSLTFAGAATPRVASFGQGVVVSASSRVNRQMPDGRLVQIQLFRDNERGEVQVNIQRTVLNANAAVLELREAAGDLELSAGLARDALKTEVP